MGREYRGSADAGPGERGDQRVSARQGQPPGHVVEPPAQLTGWLPTRSAPSRSRRQHPKADDVRVQGEGAVPLGSRRIRALEGDLQGARRFARVQYHSVTRRVGDQVVPAGNAGTTWSPTR